MTADYLQKQSAGLMGLVEGTAVRVGQVDLAVTQPEESPLSQEPCVTLAVRIGQDLVGSGRGTRTPDTRIMIPLPMLGFPRDRGAYVAQCVARVAKFGPLAGVAR